MTVRRTLGRQVMLVAIATAGLLLTPRAAKADGFVTPFIGVNFAGATGTTLVNAVDDNSKLAYGVSLGYMGKGVIGFEEDVAYSPRFVAAAVNVGQTNVFTLMSNLIIGIPIGGQTGAGVRPYVLGGVGLLRTNVERSLAAVALDRNGIGFDLGGGVNVYFSDHLGVRGDLRYFRDFSVADATSAIGIVLSQGNLDFWRGTAGLVLRF
jgi:hypothetical protein